MAWHVFVDFDGTISREDTTDVVLHRLADPAWQAVETQWQNGLIGSRQCLKEQVSMIRADPDEFDALALNFAIDPHFPDFVRQCRALRLPVTIVSDGLDRIVRMTLDRHGLGGLAINANALHYCGDRRWTLDFPHTQNTCRSQSGTCKCAVSRQASAGIGDQRDLRLLIGDGRSDQCLAEDADFVFARTGLRDYCRQRNIPHRSFHSFAQVQQLMSLLEQMPVAEEVGHWDHQAMTHA
jgi:2-hydroxy-3-keto-5-methylthiopentenyl-1-phosphate phosphatase